MLAVDHVTQAAGSVGKTAAARLVGRGLRVRVLAGRRPRGRGPSTHVCRSRIQLEL